MNIYQEAKTNIVNTLVRIVGYPTYKKQFERDLEVLGELVEKATPKKPDYEGDGYADGYMVYDTWICPCCGKRYEVDYDDYDYCPNCGQALDWEIEVQEDE